MADLALGSVNVNLSAQINNYANPVFNFVSGSGALNKVGQVYTLDFGNVLQNSLNGSAFLKLLNDVTGPADLVDGSFALFTGTDFTFSGFNPFANLAAGDSVTGLSIAESTVRAAASRTSAGTSSRLSQIPQSPVTAMRAVPKLTDRRDRRLTVPASSSRPAVPVSRSTSRSY